MTPPDLVARWRALATQMTPLDCARELEAALAKAGGAWAKIEDRREFAVPLEFWGQDPNPPHPYDIKTDWCYGDGSFLRIMHASSIGPKEFLAWGFTHVRSIEDSKPPTHASRVLPPPGGSDG